MKKVLSLALVVGFLGIGAFNASELSTKGTSYVNYNMTVAAVNGMATSTSQNKAVTDQSGNVRSTSVGGTYTVDMRLHSGKGGTGVWSQRISDNETRALSNSIDKGSPVELQISNDITTPVSVKCTGSWRSN